MRMLVATTVLIVKPQLLSAFHGVSALRNIVELEVLRSVLKSRGRPAILDVITTVQQVYTSISFTCLTSNPLAKSRIFPYSWNASDSPNLP